MRELGLQGEEVGVVLNTGLEHMHGGGHVSFHADSGGGDSVSRAIVNPRVVVVAPPHQAAKASESSCLPNSMVPTGLEV